MAKIITCLGKWQRLCRSAKQGAAHIVVIPDSPAEPEEFVEAALEAALDADLEADTLPADTPNPWRAHYADTFQDTLKLPQPREPSPDRQVDGFESSDSFEDELDALRNIMNQVSQPVQSEASSSSDFPNPQDSKAFTSLKSNAQARAKPRAKPKAKSVCVGFQ